MQRIEIKDKKLKKELSELKEKYSKSYNKFKLEYNNKYIDKNLNTIQLSVDANEVAVYCNAPDCSWCNQLSFEMVFSLLEKFFDEKGIFINIYRNPIDKNFWVLNIDILNDDNYCNPKILTRSKAKLAAVKKAFEFMEGKL